MTVSCEGYSSEKLARLKARYTDTIKHIETEATDMPIVEVDAEKVVDFLRSITNEEGFEYNFLSDLTAYDHNPPVEKVPDYGLGSCREEGDEKRFVVVYHLLSLQNKDRIRVIVRLNDGEEVPSVVGIWKSANWLEREVFDLYGVRFANHPNLRRIMLDDRWVGHPLRKDYHIKKYQRWEDSLEMKNVGFEE